jgi:hypothetical protein
MTGQASKAAGSIDMRPVFAWSLGFACLVSTVAVWTDDESPRVVEAADRSESHPSVASMRTHGVAVVPLPDSLDRSAIEPARRDLFAEGALVTVATPDARAASMPDRDPTQGVQQPPSTPPAVHVRYAGSMTTVDGDKKIFLVDGSQHVTVEPGVKLAGGYEVQAVSPAAVRLHEPQSGTVVDLPIPQLPQTP